MENVGFVLGLCAFVFYCTLSKKVAKLERLVKEAGLGSHEKDSLKEVLEKNINHYGIIEFEADEGDSALQSKPCRILDVDENWVLLKLEKKSLVKLIRIDSIMRIEFNVHS